MLEKTLESPLDCKEIQPVHPKGNQSWIFTGRTDAEAETPVLWPPDGKNWFTGKDPDAGKNCRWEEKRTTEDEMVRWHHRLNGHEFEQAPRVIEGQGGLVCCSHGVTKIQTLLSDWTELTYLLHGSVCAKSLQFCLTPCAPMDCSLPCPSVYGILQARVLEWVAISFSRGSIWPRDWTHISYISYSGRQIPYH